MKRMLFQILLVFVTSPALAQVSSENYVQTTQRISDTQVLTTTQYYDGLGRPFEKVEQRVTPSGDNLIHLQQYDGLGREWRNWNPIYSSSAFLNPSDVSSLSQSQYDDSHAFSQNNYESNPLNRVVEVEGIGEDWKGHSIKSAHLINTSFFPLNCKYYRVSMSGELQAKGYYPEGRLYVTKSTDEDGHESYEFKNLAGHVILQRVMLSGTESADTYYIYDYCGNLAFVLPPNYQDEEDLELYAYQYKYDGRGNCIWKKLPGCEPINMKYYRDRRLAFMQDGNLRKQGLWLFYVYDKLGRQVVTGTTAEAPDVSDVFAYAEYTGAGVLDGYQLHRLTITPRSFLVTNYYDDYAFMSQCDAVTQQNLSLHVSDALESAFPSNSSPNAIGNQTGKKVYLTDGTDRYMLTSLYYGKKGRVVQSHSSNLLGGWEHAYSSYTYADSPRQTKHVHTVNGKQDVVEEYDYAYDHASRLVKTTYSVNGSDKRELSVVDYDNYGRILLENIMGKDVVLHDYNVRNWPLSIESDNFKENLCYNQSNGSLYPRTSLFSGNISAQSWQCGNEVKHGYHFTYNSQSMLTDSEYSEGDRLNDGRGNYDESLSYDKMGNVQSLLRSGLLDDGSYGLIDNLSYNYHGNQLLKVDDAAVGPYYQGAFHFVDGADETVEYEYDANGNLVRDLNKGIISISYDLNNQPRKIEYNDGRNVSYLYDAEGSKLSVSYNLTAMSSAQPQMPVMQSSDVASANVSNGQKTIDYCGNIIYDGDETMILNDVGYALYNKDNNLSFHYYLKDHLGNNRVVVSENGEIEQVNDYYPTGALMASSKGGDTQRFKFNGKELDRTNGLNWYDYGARNYDAEIVVWKGVDKMADKNVTTSLYGYCNSNPIRYIDPLGTDTVDLLPSPQQDYRSYTLKLDAKYFDDDPNVINVWGHGDQNGIQYGDQHIQNADKFNEILKEHSDIWKNHKKGSPAIIVLHSCSTADFAKILSASDLFRNVLIIGPTENVKVSFYKSKLIKYDRKSGYAFYKGHYENTKLETVFRSGKVKSGIWIGYRNGKYYNSYDGGEKTRYQSDEKPGGKGFEYRTLWDRIKSCF